MYESCSFNCCYSDLLLIQEWIPLEVHQTGRTHPHIRYVLLWRQLEGMAKNVEWPAAYLCVTSPLNPLIPLFSKIYSSPVYLDRSLSPPLVFPLSNTHSHRTLWTWHTKSYKIPKCSPIGYWSLSPQQWYLRLWPDGTFTYWHEVHMSPSPWRLPWDICRGAEEGKGWLEFPDCYCAPLSLCLWRWAFNHI